jgi:hypothetical protein
MPLKVYKNEATAKSAIKREGLHMMNYIIQPHCSSAGTGFAVRFYVHDMLDLEEVQSRGFAAIINVEKAA